MGQDEHVDVVVVGSGFGGAVAAYRFARADRRVVVLERGRAYPPGSFPRAPAGLGRNLWDPSEGLHGLFDVWSFRGLDAVVSSGLGGGSLIYANVLLRKDEKWFVQESPLPRGGYEHWPISRADLDPHYDEVERMLAPQRYPLAVAPYHDTPKTVAMRDAAARLGLDWDLPPLAVLFAPRPGDPPVPGAPIPDPPYGNLHGLPRRTCTLVGECDIGCNQGAKNSLDHTYLSAARHHGADLRTRCEVRELAPRPEGGYRVSYVVHDPARQGRRTATRRLPLRTLTCDRLVLAAGTLGTTWLLLRNRAAFPGLSRALGTRFSGNGDLLSFVTRAHHVGDGHRSLEGSNGPVITSRIRVPDQLDGGPPGRGYYVEDAGYPVFADWLAESSQLSGQVRRAVVFALHRLGAFVLGSARTNVSARLAALMGLSELSDGSLPLLGMGRDVPDGVMRLRRGHLDVDWTTATSTGYFTALRATMRDIADALRGDFHDNPLSLLRKTVTVHPLGGAPMGRHPGEGVVDADGQVFGYPGLYVADGAAMPGAVGANPSLTIAAWADRLAERALAPAGRSVAAGPGAPGPVTPLTGRVATSLSFTEEMRGHVARGVADPVRGEQVGRARDESLGFHLTITADDIDWFVADPGHEARATGWVDAPALGGRLPVLQGWFNLFVSDGGPGRRSMCYRLHLRGPDDMPLTLLGRKDVHDDAGFDVWRDTSTLATRLVRGHVGPGRDDGDVLAAGRLALHLPDFLRQLTTFRTEGPEPAAALARFGRLFLGELWEVYGDRVTVGRTA
ncbi:GMC oxidoreductase [Micromonospora inyonensis]|uniref:Cholesterol oxidase n=1 Tax=Micromonospora inyonensis TaxID=47866 RepID=A0A1C6S4V4_9ACTN|nr:GMC family oxidoreductase [Micromonospora inyonensis]SCL24511.1 cholesterol oxidase [Micromonospora inyonensis]